MKTTLNNREETKSLKAAAQHKAVVWETSCNHSNALRLFILTPSVTRNTADIWVFMCEIHRTYTAPKLLPPSLFTDSTIIEILVMSYFEKTDTS